MEDSVVRCVDLPLEAIDCDRFDCGIVVNWSVVMVD